MTPSMVHRHSASALLASPGESLPLAKRVVGKPHAPFLLVEFAVFNVTEPCRKNRKTACASRTENSVDCHGPS